MADLAVRPVAACPDMKAAMVRRGKEPSPVGRNILDQLLENADIAAKGECPSARTQAWPWSLPKWGQDAHIVGGAFEDAVNEGVRRGYVDGYLRKSCVAEPLFERKNTRDNTLRSSTPGWCPVTICVCVWPPRGPDPKTRACSKCWCPRTALQACARWCWTLF